MHFDLAQIPDTDAYKLLVSTVVPRPIALATTVDRDRRVNDVRTEKMRLIVGCTAAVGIRGRAICF